MTAISLNRPDAEAIEKEWNENRITLKNVKYAAFASEETHCYSASVYFDNKRVGTVKNDGHGGCDYQYIEDEQRWPQMLDYITTQNETPTDADKGAACRAYAEFLRRMGDAQYFEFQQSDEDFLKEYGSIEHSDDETFLEASLKFNSKDLEHICCTLVNQFLGDRELKSLLRRKFVWQKENGEVYECARRKGHTVKAMAEVIAKAEPTSKLLNAMPFDQAREILAAI